MSIEKLVRFTSTFVGESVEIDDATGQLFLNMEGLNEPLDITPNAAADTVAYLRDLADMFSTAADYWEKNNG